MLIQLPHSIALDANSDYMTYCTSKDYFRCNIMNIRSHKRVHALTHS